MSMYDATISSILKLEKQVEAAFSPIDVKINIPLLKASQFEDFYSRQDIWRTFESLYNVWISTSSETKGVKYWVNRVGYDYLIERNAIWWIEPYPNPRKKPKALGHMFFDPLQFLPARPAYRGILDYHSSLDGKIIVNSENKFRFLVSLSPSLLLSAAFVIGSYGFYPETKLEEKKGEVSFEGTF